MKRILAGMCAIALLMLVAGCSSPADKPSTNAEKANISYVNPDWPYYRTAQELVEAADNIFEGRIVRAFYDVLEVRNGQVAKAQNPEKDAELWLYMVYEIEITKSYKGVEEGKILLCSYGDNSEADIAEQVVAREAAGVHNEQTTFCMMDCMDLKAEKLSVGESFLFLSAATDGEYNYIVNPDQFVFADGDRGDNFGYAEIVEVCLPELESIS